MMNLTVDFGNTSVKVVVFDDTIPVFRNDYKNFTASHADSIIWKFNISACIISNVVKVNSRLMTSLRKIKHFHQLSHKTKIPVKNRYKTPETLGSDRLANAIAGAFLFPKKNVLIIDAGTCIKYDFVDKNNIYQGGSISPGVDMRFKALHHFTGKLPLIKERNFRQLTGKSTSEAIQSGVINGITEEIKGLISRYSEKHGSLKVILTGGDAFRFAGELNLSIFAAADLVNIGLNEIIRSGKEIDLIK